MSVIQVQTWIMAASEYWLVSYSDSLCKSKNSVWKADICHAQCTDTWWNVCTLSIERFVLNFTFTAGFWIMDLSGYRHVFVVHILILPYRILCSKISFISGACVPWMASEYYNFWSAKSQLIQRFLIFRCLLFRFSLYSEVRIWLELRDHS